MLASLSVATLALSGFAAAAPSVEKRCTGTINSINDVAAAIKCTTININAFTVPAYTTLDLDKLKKGTTVNLLGTVTFTGKSKSGWKGPLMIVGGEDIMFQGNSHTLDGQGAKYWDTKGSNGGVDKPKFIKLHMGGHFNNVVVKNAPVQTFSVGNKTPLQINNIYVDNRDGNKLSGGKTLGHNSDCFDVSANDVIISRSTCNNQDDCLALNKGNNVEFRQNTCIGGHGISIGSIKSDHSVSKVRITDNVVKDGTNGLRIKTYNGATDASVSDVVYSGNTVSNTSKYGVVIQQDYENGSPTGTATNGVPIKDVRFTGTNNVAVTGSKAQEVYVLCGKNTCTGNWDWSGLKTSGGKAGSISPSNVPIKNYKL